MRRGLLRNDDLVSAFPQCGGLVCPGSKRCGGFEQFIPDSGFVGGWFCVEPTPPCIATTGGSCVSLGSCAPPNVCQYTPILPHVDTCPCCGCGPPQ